MNEGKRLCAYCGSVLEDNYIISDKRSFCNSACKNVHQSFSETAGAIGYRKASTLIEEDGRLRIGHEDT